MFFAFLFKRLIIINLNGVDILLFFATDLKYPNCIFLQIASLNQ